MVRRVWAFVMVLSLRRHMFVKPVFRMDAKTWVECHILAFEFFGGVPRRIALDNLKGGVLKPSTYDPAFNRDYAQMASHYGILVDPCRQGHPKDSPASRDRSRTSGKVAGAAGSSAAHPTWTVRQ
jgi:transposase